MNDSPKKASKAIALFLSLGMISSLAGCETGDTEGEEVEEGTTIEEPVQEEGGEGGEG